MEAADKLLSHCESFKSLHPLVNYLPRVVGCALTAPVSSRTYGDESTNCVCFVTERLLEYNISVFYQGGCPSWSVDFKALGIRSDCWQEPGSRVVIAALPDEAIPALKLQLQALGREITYQEPCRTWEMPEGVWYTLADRLERTQPEIFDAVIAAARIAKASPEACMRAVDYEYVILSRALGLPEGFVLDRLRAEDAVVVNANWTYRNGALTEGRIRDNILTLPSACIRKVSHSATGNTYELCSWVLVRVDGSLGILHTLPAYRGRRYASFTVNCVIGLLRRWQQVLVALSRSDLWEECSTADVMDDTAYTLHCDRKVLKLGNLLRPYCHIKVGNEPSERLFGSLSFAPVNFCSWLVSASHVKADECN